MTGFLQRSVIGPFGFKPYIMRLTDIARKHGVSIHVCADDTYLYRACDSDDTETAVA